MAYRMMRKQYTKGTLRMQPHLITKAPACGMGLLDIKDFDVTEWYVPPDGRIQSPMEPADLTSRAGSPWVCLQA